MSNSKGTKKKKTPQDMFECLGVILTDGPGDQLVGDCPFCGKADHFFVNSETGQYDCKVCTESGNPINFLGRISEKLFSETKKKDWKRLAKLRSVVKLKEEQVHVEPPLPSYVFSHFGMCWNTELNEWWLPSKSEKGTTRDIRRWNPDVPRFISTDYCNVQLGNMEEFSSRKDRTRVPVWICEGEWDGMCLWYLLKQAGRDEIVTWVPGAGTFKEEWAKWYQGCNVRAVYDNDDAGDKGSKKSGALLKPMARKLEYVCWPELHTPGYDVKDFVLEARHEGVDPKDAYDLLIGLLSSKHRRDGGKAGLAVNVAEKAQRDKLQTVAWNDLLAEFKRHVKVDKNFEDGLALSLATAASGHLTGEPLWMYLIGAPGCGKTLILASLKAAEQVIYESTITRTSLISGYDKGPDQSLLPKLDQKCGVFKDGTTILGLHPDARRELYGTLRDAFDGETSRPFGNIHRHYVSHFNLLIGVTPAIKSENQSDTGERFLRFEMREKNGSENDKMDSALASITKESIIQSALEDTVSAFLLREINVEKFPKISDETADRLKAMASLIAVLRAQVVRHYGFEKELKYRAVREVPTRALKQLAKLGIMLCWVFGQRKFDENVMRLLMRVTLNTCTSYHVDIVRAMIREGNGGMTAREIMEASKITHSATLVNRLLDMEQLQIVYRVASDDPDDPRKKITHWHLSKSVVELWHRSRGINGDE